MKNIPDTSREAYHSLKHAEITAIYQKVIVALKSIGEGTFEEIAVAANLEPSQVWKRLSEMFRAETIYRPGNKRALKSGRQGYTWKLKVCGEAPTIVTEKFLPGPSIADFSKGILKDFVQKELF